VLICSVPRLLDDILAALFSEDTGVTVVRCPPGVTSLPDAAALTEADVVIAAEQDAGPREVSALLERVPHVRALAVADDARTGLLYELHPRRRLIDELSAESVRAAICQARGRTELFFDPQPAP